MVYKWDCTFHNWGHKWHHVTYNGHNPSTAWGFGSLGVTNGCVWNFGIPSEKGHWIIEYMGMIQTYPLELGVANWRSQIEILQRKMVVLNKLCMGKPGVWTCFWRCSGCELAGKKVEIGRCNSVKSGFFFWARYFGMDCQTRDYWRPFGPVFHNLRFLFDFFWAIESLEGPCPEGLR